MDYRRLGHTGLRVSRLCVGAMVLGRWGNPDHEDCVRILHRAFDEGINFVDTANRYGTNPVLAREKRIKSTTVPSSSPNRKSC